MLAGGDAIMLHCCPGFCVDVPAYFRQAGVLMCLCLYWWKSSTSSYWRRAIFSHLGLQKFKTFYKQLSDFKFDMTNYVSHVTPHTKIDVCHRGKGGVAQGMGKNVITRAFSSFIAATAHRQKHGLAPSASERVLSCSVHSCVVILYLCSSFTPPPPKKT